MRYLAMGAALAAVFAAAGCASDPQAGKQAGQGATADKVPANELEGVMKVQAIRKDHGLAAICA